MSGEPDAAYVLARRVLLDALEALGPHRPALVLVGAQAVYPHTGEADLAVPPYTTDGDLALIPDSLADEPTIEEAMGQAGFTPGKQPGTWERPGPVAVDLLVPASLGGAGRRGARLGVHGKRAARKVQGLEAALVDRQQLTITALEENDPRSCSVAVAGPAALMVAKLHKLWERVEEPGRRQDKDALDLLRILRAVSTDDLAATIRMLSSNTLSADVTAAAMRHLRDLFGTHDAPGSRMAARAAEPFDDPATIANSCAILAGDLLAALEPLPT